LCFSNQLRTHVRHNDAIAHPKRDPRADIDWGSGLGELVCDDAGLALAGVIVFDVNHQPRAAYARPTGNRWTEAPFHFLDVLPSEFGHQKWKLALFAGLAFGALRRAWRLKCATRPFLLGFGALRGAWPFNYSFNARDAAFVPDRRRRL
jgi:hypothetical protein